MCRAATCHQCGKTTWAGCGEHVDQVMAAVPREDRCEGHPPAGRTGRSGRFGRLFGLSQR